MQALMDRVINLLSGTTDLSQVRVNLIYLVLLIAAYVIVSFISQLFFRKLNFTAGFGLNLKMYENLLSLPLERVQAMASGELTSRITDDSLYISAWNGAGKVSFVSECVWLIASLGLMAYYSISITGVVLALILLGYKLSGLVQNRIAEHTKEYQVLSGEVNSQMIESIQGLEEIKGYDARLYFYKSIEDKIQVDQYKCSKKLSLLYSLYVGIQVLLAYALPAIVVILALILSLKGKISLGSILALYALSQQIQEPIRVLNNLNQDRQTSREMISRNDFLLRESKSKAVDEAGSLNEVMFHIKEFSYEEASPILTKIMGKIKAGDQIFIKGKSGSGKSTLAKIIGGLVPIEKEEGLILWNGKKYDNLNLGSNPSASLIARQDPYIFKGSIRDNLFLGQSLDEDLIAKALDLSMFDEIVEKYGLDYQLSEQGKNLSGGQRQRLSICRALLRNPDLLILDEPSSALNQAMGNNMVGKIRKAYKDLGKSLIILTHDESLIEEGDECWIL